MKDVLKTMLATIKVVVLMGVGIISVFIGVIISCFETEEEEVCKHFYKVSHWCANRVERLQSQTIFR